MVGGAYSGKRQLIKQWYSKLKWHSAYQGATLANWKDSDLSDEVLILEGFELWVKERWLEDQDIDQVRTYFKNTINQLEAFAEKENQQIVLIMLEMGRGIVPISREERILRDLCGWILQDATTIAKEVYYCWHGLERRMK